MTEAIRGYSLAQRQYDLDSGPDREYKLDPEQAVECICCRQDWNQEDCKEYKGGFVCCDCEYEYITQLVEKNARRLAPEYIASDLEVEKDFYINWWFNSLDDDEKVEALKCAMNTLKSFKFRDLAQEFAEEDDGFREFVERKEEA